MDWNSTRPQFNVVYNVGLCDDGEIRIMTPVDTSAGGPALFLGFRTIQDGEYAVHSKE